MAENPGVQYPVLDEEGNQLTKAAGVRASTYGRWNSRGFAFDASAPVAPATEAETKFRFRLPYKIDLVQGAIFLESAQKGDEMSFSIAPDTSLNVVAGQGVAVQVLTSPVAVGDKQLTFVPAYLAAFVNSGLVDEGQYEVAVTDGVNTEQALVTGYDKATGVVTLGQIKSWTGAEPASWTGFANAYPATATVRVSHHLIMAYEVDGGDQTIFIGASARSAAPIPANTLMELAYLNRGAATRRVRFAIDHFSGKPLSAGG
jgi:hypothetical protein